VVELLKPHKKFIRDDVMRGLPELTNESGAYCRDSCATQMWSCMGMIEVLSDLGEL
jgi:glycogen debranching enzyme